MAALRVNRPRSSILASLSLLLQLIVLFVLFMCCQCVDLGCREVKTAYRLKGYDDTDVPIQAISGEHLEVCPQGFTCCTKGMEDSLSAASKQEYEHSLQSAIQLTQKLFATRTAKFDRFFIELLEKAKADLHEMFVRTYGLIYQQNSQVFMDLFTDLRGYYKGRNINLMEALESFFVRLLKKMFPLMNSRFMFSEDYLNCVVENMNDLQPFGDVPQKLKKEVRKAFVAARTFVQGLAIGRDVVEAVGDIPPTQSCGRALMKMMYCPHCRGLTHTKPCNNLCLNTLKGCLAYHAELNKAWNQYIDALMLLADRLEGPFNIESVVDPIDVKISDAIMNFQENDRVVSKKIFAGCGKPEMRRKRDISSNGQNETDAPPSGIPVVETGVDGKSDKSDSSDDLAYGSPYRYKPSISGSKPVTAAGTNLHRLVIDIKKKIKTVKDFWVDLPYTVCNDETIAAQPGEDDNCWNGQDKAKYVPEVQQDGVINQVNNPEVDVDVTKTSNMIVVQIKQLTLITDKLHNAYLGHDVDWVDIELDSEFSGSGSGSGSGVEPVEPNHSKTTDPYYFVPSNSRPTAKSRPRTTPSSGIERHPRPSQKSRPKSTPRYPPSSSSCPRTLTAVLVASVAICWLHRYLWH